MPKNNCDHAANFMPWIGYFGLMDYVDEFIYLDHVQFDKRSWQQRNRIKTANGPIWMTVPAITKGRYQQSINEVEINLENEDFPKKIIKTIEQNYKKSACYDAYAQEFFTVFETQFSHLLNLNIAMIDLFRKHLNIETPTLFSSDIQATGTKAELLANICKQRGANIYISPPGSRDYLEDTDSFETAGIEVTYFEYEHPSWEQPHGDFEAYMSALDLLFNMGENSFEYHTSGSS